MLLPQVSSFPPLPLSEIRPSRNSSFAIRANYLGKIVSGPIWPQRQQHRPNKAGSMTSNLIETKLLRISDDEPPPLRIVFSFVSKNICFLTTPSLLRNKLVVDLFPFFAVIFQSRCLIDLRGIEEEFSRTSSFVVFVFYFRFEEGKGIFKSIV